MTVRVGINGYGRIGRVFHRVLLSRPGPEDLAVVAVNDPAAGPDTLGFLLEHDSVYGRLAPAVEETQAGFAVGGQEVAVWGHSSPDAVPWSERDVQVIVECSGRFSSRAQAASHLGGSVHHVVISAPSADADLTVCVGVNDDLLQPDRHQVIANASCTTNCLAPMARALEHSFGIEQGFITTVHAYTTGQNLLDAPRVGRSGKVDLRRMRAAGLSIVPTTTGATRAVAQVLPELAGRLAGMALRVPVPVGSVVDLVARLRREVSSPLAVNEVFEAAAADPSYRGVLVCTAKPLVSADIVGEAASCVFSAADTMAEGRMVKVLGWYDNEWAYATRLADLVGLVAA